MFFIKTSHKYIFLFFLLMVTPHPGLYSFGFAAHRKINRMAVFTLPEEMIGFFKYHIDYISHHAIDPDRRAHAVEGEAQRHYIDIEYYGNSPFDSVPRYWKVAVEKYTEDSLQMHGILPWHMNIMMYRLTKAFEEENPDRILYNATHIGHYIADLCTPLHTTKYYNGRTPEQKGIHALWETRLVELYADSYDFLVGRANYLESPSEKVWEVIKKSHLTIDTIYHVYDSLYNAMPQDLIYAPEMRGQTTTIAYSRIFSNAIHNGLNGMIERQMQRAVKLVGDFWYTAWVNAGQPDLYKLEKKSISIAHRRALKQEEEEFKKRLDFQGKPNPR